MNKKLCKDCKFCDKHNHLKAICYRPVEDFDLIDGKYVSSLGEFCAKERGFGRLTARLFRRCGKEARFFQPKKK